MRRLGVVSAAVVALLVVPTGEVAAAPAPWRCSYDGAGALPATFPLDGCVQNGWLTLHNAAEYPVQVVVGGAGAAVVVRTDGDPVHAVTRLAVGGEGVLLPSDVVRWPLGSGPAALEVRGLRPATAAPIAEGLADVLPDPATRGDLRPYGSLVRDLATAVAQQRSCVRDANFLGRAACDVRTASAIGRAVRDRLSGDAVADVAAIVLEPARWREWAEQRTPDVWAMLRVDQRGLVPEATIPAAPPPTVVVTGPAAPPQEPAAPAGTAGGMRPPAAEPVPGPPPPAPAPAPPPRPAPPGNPPDDGPGRPGDDGDDGGDDEDDEDRDDEDRDDEDDDRDRRGNGKDDHEGERTKKDD